MNLTMNEQGKVELNGEPIVEWFKKRDLHPCIMSYARTNHIQKCCLTGAMGFAAVEDKMTFAEFEQKVDKGEKHPLQSIAEILGEPHADLAEIEQGYMFDWKRLSELSRLGGAAREELFDGFDTLSPA